LTAICRPARKAPESVTKCVTDVTLLPEKRQINK
jgi:hypothetical protein